MRKKRLTKPRYGFTSTRASDPAFADLSIKEGSSTASETSAGGSLEGGTHRVSFRLLDEAGDVDDSEDDEDDFDDSGV